MLRSIRRGQPITDAHMGFYEFNSMPFGLINCTATFQRLITVASRGFKPSERHYLAYKLEFLALKWAVTDTFHDYMYGQQFHVWTYNNPLTYVLTSARTLKDIEGLSALQLMISPSNV